MEHDIWTFGNAPENKKYKWETYFRDLPEEIRSELQMDEVGSYSITDMKSADQISKLIIKILNTNNATVLDLCAGIGGNTISFAKYFTHVTAVEVSLIRCQILEHNLNLLELHKNVDIVNENLCSIIDYLLFYDVIFIDPPWGGIDYKNYETIDICINENISFAEVCCRLSLHTKMVVLKLPVNFNLEKFRRDTIDSVEIIYTTLKIRKMLVIVLRSLYV